MIIMQNLSLKPAKLARGFGAALLALAVLELSACSRSNHQPSSNEQMLFGEDELSSTKFSSIYGTTLSAACVECHNPSGMATVNYNVQLNFMNQAAAYTSLMESSVNGATSAGTCGPVKIVVPGQPQNSYLIGTLIPRYANGNFGGVGGCTPYAGHYTIINLSSSQQAGLIGWVQDGAQND